MKKKMIFALLLAGMSFATPNVADACSVSSCGVSCDGDVCYGYNSGVYCKKGKVTTIKECPKTVAGM